SLGSQAIGERTHALAHGLTRALDPGEARVDAPSPRSQEAQQRLVIAPTPELELVAQDSDPGLVGVFDRPPMIRLTLLDGRPPLALGRQHLLARGDVGLGHCPLAAERDLADRELG